MNPAGHRANRPRVLAPSADVGRTPTRLLRLARWGAGHTDRVQPLQTAEPTPANQSAEARQSADALPDSRLTGLLEDARAVQDRTIELRRRLHRHPEVGLHLPRTQAISTCSPTSTWRSASHRNQLGRRRPARRPAGPDGPAARRHGRACRCTRTPGSPFASEVARRDARLRARHPRGDAARRRPAARRARATCWPARSCSCSSRARRASTAPATCWRRACSTSVPRRRRSTRRVRAAHLLHAAQRSGQRPARADDGRGRPVADRRPRPRRARLRAAPRAATRSRSRAEIVLALQSMVTRRVDVFDPAVVTVGAHRGRHRPTTSSPTRAILEGTIRTLSAERSAPTSSPRCGGWPTHVAAAHDADRRVRARRAATRSRSTTRGGRRRCSTPPTELLGERAAVRACRDAAHGRRGLLLRAAAGARRDGLPRRLPAGARPGAGRPQPLQPRGVRRGAAPAGVALYAAVALRTLG